jgi:RNA recognition motif-containing protein
MAERALKLNNYNIKGKPIKVYISRPPGEGGENDERTIFVRDLPFTSSEEKLREHFKDIGEIEEVRLIRND